MSHHPISDRMSDCVKRLHYGYTEIFLYDKFKQPERYRIVYKKLGTVYVEDRTSYPEDIVGTYVGYLFIKGKRNTIKKKLEDELDCYDEEIPYTYEEVPKDDRNTIHLNLEHLFDEKTRYVIKCVPKHNSVHPLLIRDYSFLFEDDSDKAIEENISNIFKTYKEKLMETIKEEKINSITSWVNYLTKTCPINEIGLPICFNKQIYERDFRGELKIDSSNVMLIYDTKTKKEFQIIKTIEQFEDKNRKVVFYETYNNILPEVKARLRALDKPFKELNEISIELRWCDLNDLGLKWKITDFI